jgi:hypothetical protein
MSEWSHLPNAQHIDRVLASVNKHPRIWCVAFDLAWAAARRGARAAAWNAVRDATRGEVWDVAAASARDSVGDMASYAARSAAYDAAYDAILALFAYDDCAHYLDMPSEQLRMWATLTEHPAAVLLLPAVIAFERIKELETV